MDEKEQEQIKNETKKLLDKFSIALSKIKSEESNVERDSDRRKEGEGKIGDESFRKIMFENAPAKSEEFILAERKKW
jgi:hypothetical protein